MKTTITIAGLLVAAIILGSCQSGPNGPDPATELYIEYEGPLAGQKLEQRRSSAVQLSDIQTIATNPDNNTRFLQTKKFDFFFTQSSDASGNEVRFYLADKPSFSSTMTLFFENSIPSSPGTYAWQEATSGFGFPGSLSVKSGPLIRYDGGLTFYPVEGETVILNVTKDGNNVTFIEGYFNGTMKTSQQVLNPGDAPITLTMKVQSGLFKHPRP